MKERLESIFQEHAFQDFKWIDPCTIKVSQWVRMKCLYGCNEYGKNATCPPNAPSIAECERFFQEYRHAVLFHVSKRLDSPDGLRKWVRGINRDLLKVEQTVFLAGFEKALMLMIDSCCICTQCVPKKEDCRNPKCARPTVEALAVDVYHAAKTAGYHIEVKTDTAQEMDRFALLMVD